MYNLFVSADINNWEEKNSFEVAQDRLFEHSALKEKFKKELSVNKDYFFPLPCIFAYEDYCKKNPKFGFITNIRDSSNQKKYFDYVIVKLEKFLTYQDLSDMSKELDIGDYEMNRTHWAVKDVDLYAVLATKGIKLPKATIKNNEIQPAIKEPNNSIIIKNSSVHLGRGDINNGVTLKSDKENSLFSKFWWLLIIPIIVGVIVYIITTGKIPASFVKFVGPAEMNNTKDVIESTSTVSVQEILAKSKTLKTSLDQSSFLEKYKDSEVYGKGLFLDIDKSGNDKYIILMDVAGNRVSCFFDLSYEKKLLVLQNRQEINFRGIFKDGNLAGWNSWVIENCSMY